MDHQMLHALYAGLLDNPAYDEQKNPRNIRALHCKCPARSAVGMQHNVNKVTLMTVQMIQGTLKQKGP